MTKNGKVGDGHRNGMVKGRSQVLNPITKQYVKRDTSTGRFMDAKTSGGKFKGVSIQSIGNSLVVYGFITSLFIKVKKNISLFFIVLAIIYNIINPTMIGYLVDFFTKQDKSQEIKSQGNSVIAKNMTININNVEIKNYNTPPSTSPVPHDANDLVVVVVPLKIQYSTLKALTSFVETDPDANESLKRRKNMSNTTLRKNQKNQLNNTGINQQKLLNLI